MGLCISKQNNDSVRINIDGDGKPHLDIHLAGLKPNRTQDVTERMHRLSEMGLEEVRRRGLGEHISSAPRTKVRIYSDGNGSMFTVPQVPDGNVRFG